MYYCFCFIFEQINAACSIIDLFYDFFWKLKSLEIFKIHCHFWINYSFNMYMCHSLLPSDPLLGKEKTERDGEGAGFVCSRYIRAPEEPDILHYLPCAIVCI